MTAAMTDLMTQEIRDRLIALEITGKNTAEMLGKMVDSQQHVVKAIERISLNQEHLSSLGHRVHELEHDLISERARILALEKWREDNKEMPVHVDRNNQINKRLTWLSSITTAGFVAVLIEKIFK